MITRNSAVPARSAEDKQTFQHLLKLVQVNLFYLCYLGFVLVFTSTENNKASCCGSRGPKTPARISAVNDDDGRRLPRSPLIFSSSSKTE